MATLRDHIRLKTGELVPLNTSQSAGYSTKDLLKTEGIPDIRTIRIIPFQEVARTQDLLHVAEDLIENDRQINNEKNAGSAILCEGVFNEYNADFSVELTYDNIQRNLFKYLKVTKGKFKTIGNIYEIQDDVYYGLTSEYPSSPTPLTELPISPFIGYDEYDYVIISGNPSYNGLYQLVNSEWVKQPEYIINDMINVSGKPFRRDYISIVYYDTDVTKTTPYWRYVEGERYSSQPLIKHLQKFYEYDDEGELWDAALNKVDSNGQPARFKEFIIYSISFEYNSNGIWKSLSYTTSITPPSGGGTSGQLIEVFAGGVYTLYKYSGSWAIQTNTAIYNTEADFDNFPPLPSSPDVNKYIKLNFVYNGYPIGWYKKDLYNQFTDLRLIELVPTLTGIADVVNFTNTEWVYTHKTLPNEFKILKVSGVDRQLFHPFKRFRRLELEYGQGDASALNASKFELPSNLNYVTNSLTYDYIDLNNNNSSKRNFPFIVPEIPNEFIIQDTIKLNHILLGYKKEGFWNKDYIQDSNNNKFYQLVNNKWEEITIALTCSNFPQIPVNGTYFHVAGILYQFNGTIWNTVTFTNQATFPITPAPINGQIARITGTGLQDKGWYQFNSNSDGYWERINILTGDILPTTTLFNNSFYFFCSGNDISYFDVPDIGLYQYNKNSWNKISYSEGATFPIEHLIHGQYFKDTDDNSLHKYVSGSWITIPSGKILPEDIDYPFDANSGDYDLTCDVVLRTETPPIDNTTGNYYFNPVTSELFTWVVNTWVEVDPFELVTELPYETISLNDGSVFYVYNPTTSKTYTYNKNVNGGTFEDDGMLWKSINENDPSKPAYGWYKYFYLSQSWARIHASEADEYPLTNLQDNLYFESTGNGTIPSGLYLYESDTAYWEEITITFPNQINLPISAMELGDYAEVNGTGDDEKGIYIYSGEGFISHIYKIENGLPEVEDDFTIDIITPKIFKNSFNVIDVPIELINTASVYHNVVTGTYEIKTFESITLFNKIGTTTENIAIGDCVLVTEGFGKDQIGNVLLISDAGTVNERIVIAGLISGIRSQSETLPSKIAFFKPTDYVIVDTKTISKNDVMNQIDFIDEFVPDDYPSIDETMTPKKISERQNIYEIKFDLDITKSINKNEWNIIRTKSSLNPDSGIGWKIPSITIANIDHIERNGYYNFRCSTITGMYPYYGIDQYGEIDKSLEYFVIKDSCDGGSTFIELQEISKLRTPLFGFNEYKVTAQNLDDINAPLLYQYLLSKPINNEVFVDVAHGRIMFHPEIMDVIHDNPLYKINISFIILNVINGYLTTDSIVHIEKNDKKTVLQSKIRELEDSINEINWNNTKKLFNYRGKWSKPYIDNSQQARLLNYPGIQLLTDPDDILAADVYFCDETGIYLDSIYDIEPKEAIARLVSGDTFTTNMHLFNKPFYKVGDYFKHIVNETTFQWYKFSTTWDAIIVTTGSEYPLTPTTNDYFESDGTGSVLKGLYQYNGTSWVLQTSFAFPYISEVMPTEVYVESSITLAQEDESTLFDDRIIKASMYGWTKHKNIEFHKFVGIRLKSLGSGWNNLCMLMFTDTGMQIGDPVLIPYANVEDIMELDINNKDKYIYFELDENIWLDNLDINFNYYFYVDSIPTVAPELLGYNDSGNFKGFFKTLCKFQPNIIGYPDNKTFRLVNNINGDPIVGTNLNTGQALTLDIINPITNLPLIEENGYNFVIPVDFSDSDIWDTWNYANCIGIDIRLGRVKIPSSMVYDELAFEFNANWANEHLSAKAVSLSINPNASLEDVFGIYDMYSDTQSLADIVDSRIAIYSPKEDRFTATGVLGEPFLLTFTPDSTTHFTSDAIKKSLIVVINGEVIASTEFTITNRILQFNNQLNLNDIVIVKGIEYKTLTTVDNGTITPDHFSTETQQLFQDLRDIRDVYFDQAIEEAKNELEVFVDFKLNEACVPKENIFRINGGNIERYNSITSTWVSLGAGFNDFDIDWTPQGKYSLLIFVNNMIQSSLTFDLFGLDNKTIRLSTPLVESDILMVKGNIVKPQTNPLDHIVPYEHVVNVLIPTTTIEFPFNIPTKDHANIFIDGLYQSGDNFTIDDSGLPARIIGFNDITAEMDLNHKFDISVNGGVVSTIDMNTHVLNLDEIVTYVNGLFTVAGLSANLIAKKNFTETGIMFETITKGALQLITIASNTPDGLALFGMSAGDYYGNDIYTTVIFDEEIPAGRRVIIKSSLVMEQRIVDDQITYENLSPALKTLLGI